MSGKFFLHGLYPLQDISFKEEIYQYLELHSPLKNTIYETIFNNISSAHQCEAGPVIQIPHKFDITMHTRNCKRVHKYINEDGFDIGHLTKMVSREFT